MSKLISSRYMEITLREPIVVDIFIPVAFSYRTMKNVRADKMTIKPRSLTNILVSFHLYDITRLNVNKNFEVRLHQDMCFQRNKPGL